MNKKHIFIILPVLCICIISMGCSNEISEEEYEEFKNEIHEDMSNIISIITSDLSKSDDWDNRASVYDSLESHNKSISEKVHKVEKEVPKNKQDEFENVYSKVSTESVLLLYYIIGSDYGEKEKENINEILNRWRDITGYAEETNSEDSELSEAFFEEILKKNKQEKNKNTMQSSLKIEDIELIFESDYMYFSGYVKNNGDRTYNYVKIKAVYLDDSDNIIDTDWTYAVTSEGIAHNERKRFEIMTRYTEGVTKGNLSILDYQ